MTVDPSEKFKHCIPFFFSCSCKHSFRIDGVLRKGEPKENENPNSQTQNQNISSCLFCPSCMKKISRAHFLNKLDSEMRKYFDKFYSFTLMCTDESCSFKTNHVYLNKKPSCFYKFENGKLCNKEMRLVFDSFQLHQQICYLSYIFNPHEFYPSFIKKNFSDVTEEMRQEKVREFDQLLKEDFLIFDEARRKIQSIQERNARTMVDLGSVFNFYKTMKK